MYVTCTIVCMYVCMHIGLYVCMYVCMYIYRHVRMYVYATEPLQQHYFVGFDQESVSLTQTEVQPRPHDNPSS